MEGINYYKERQDFLKTHEFNVCFCKLLARICQKMNSSDSIQNINLAM